MTSESEKRAEKTGKQATPMTLVTIASGWTAKALFVGFSGLGLFELAQSFYRYAQHHLAGAPGPSEHSLVIVGALGGLELLFLAPLAYLVLLSVYRYTSSASWKAEPERIGRTASAVIHEVKSQIASLMIAVLATEMLRSILQHSEISLATSIATLGLILVLILYVRVLNPHDAERH